MFWNVSNWSEIFKNVEFNRRIRIPKVLNLFLVWKISEIVHLTWNYFNLILNLPIFLLVSTQFLANLSGTVLLWISLFKHIFTANQLIIILGLFNYFQNMNLIFFNVESFLFKSSKTLHCWHCCSALKLLNNVEITQKFYNM